jgi:hypothetical protein
MIGYRGWDLGFVDGQFRLVGANGFLWGERNLAICDQGKLIEHLIMQTPGHGCGLYSVKSFAFSDRLMGNVFGSIDNYGTVFEHTEGYRSSNANINTIYRNDMPCEKHGIVEFAGDFYNLKRATRVTITERSIEFLCDEHAAGKQSYVLDEMYRMLAAFYKCRIDYLPSEAKPQDNRAHGKYLPLESLRKQIMAGYIIDNFEHVNMTKYPPISTAIKLDIVAEIGIRRSIPLAAYNDYLFIGVDRTPKGKYYYANLYTWGFSIDNSVYTWGMKPSVGKVYDYTKLPVKTLVFDTTREGVISKLRELFPFWNWNFTSIIAPLSDEHVMQAELNKYQSVYKLANMSDYPQVTSSSKLDIIAELGVSDSYIFNYAQHSGRVYYWLAGIDRSKLGKYTAVVYRWTRQRDRWSADPEKTGYL